MSANTKAPLLDQLRDSGLLEPAQLEELARLPEAHDANPRSLAHQVLQRGWLNHFQLNLLAQGRGPELLIGPYVLLDRLGEGGMGQVYKARHRHMARVVALKVIRKDKLRSPQSVQRFYQEVRVAAQLAHPNIVLAYDAGEAGGTHFLSMEYVEGKDLSRTVKEGGPLPAARACDYVRQAAVGLQHAYERGMVHRDIKPHNLLVAPAEPGAPGPGWGTVKILDMGLARINQGLSERERQLTHTGAVLGTPDYLAPEQALNARAADIRSDLYALGGTLYYLLAGQAPFHAESLTQLLLMHQMEQAAPIESLRPDVPAEVARLVRRLLAKRPEDRPQTPAEVAAALGPYGAPDGAPAPAAARPRAAPPADEFSWATQASRDGGPGRAKAVSAERTLAGEGLRARGKKGVAPRGPQAEGATGGRKVLIFGLIGAALAVPLVALVAVGLAFLMWRTKATSYHPPGQELVNAPRVLDPAPRKPPRDPAPSAVNPAPLPPPPPTAHELRRFLTGERASGDCPFSADGRRILGVMSASPLIWPVEPGQVALRLKVENQSSFSCGRFSPDGRRVFLGSLDRGVYSWDVKTNHVGRLFRTDGWVNCMALSADGRRLLVGSGNRVIRDGQAQPVGCVVTVWDVPGQREVCRFTGHADPVYFIDLSADGRRALSLGESAVCLWDAETGQEVRRLPSGGRNQGVARAFLLPEGHQALLMGGSGGQVQIWDLDAGRLIHGFGDPSMSVGAGAVSADGRYAVTSTHRAEVGGGKMEYHDCLLHLWDVPTGKELRCFEGHTAAIDRVTISPDGRYAVSASFDQTVRLWDLFPGAPVAARPSAVPLAPAEAGPAPATVKEQAPEVKTGAAPRAVPQLLGHQGAVVALAASPDGLRLLSGSTDGTVRLWDVAGRKQRFLLDGAHGEVHSVRLSPDGKVAAAGGAEGLWMWDADTGERFRTVNHRELVNGVAFSPDGRLLLAAGARASLYAWRVPERRFDWGGYSAQRGPHRCLAAVPGGPLLLYGADDGTVHVYDEANRKELGKPVRSSHPITGIAAAPNGHEFAAITAVIVQVWDLETGLPGRIFGHPGRVQDVAYSPDGHSLLTACDDHLVRLWDARTGREVRRFSGHGAAVRSVAFSGDGRLAFSGGDDKTIRVWELAR